jgi:hypothetical protein
MFTKAGVEITQISWSAPTTNTDGSPVTSQLTYNLYSWSVGGTLAKNLLSFPGTLNADGRYSFPLDQIGAFDADGDYDLSLTAVDAEGDESDHSNHVIITRQMAPNAPTGLTAI